MHLVLRVGDFLNLKITDLDMERLLLNLARRKRRERPYHAPSSESSPPIIGLLQSVQA